MKNLRLILLFMILGFAAKSQVRFPTGFPSQFNTGWNRWGYAMSDSGTIIANRDTNWLAKFSGTVVFKPSNKKFYWFDSTNLTWNLFGSTIDTTSLSNRINLKLNISDTANMLLPYLRKADTTNKWVQDVYVRNDSLFKFKNGSETFLDTLGNGGSPGSGLTSVGLSLPSAFTVTNSPLTSNGTLNVIGAGTTLQYIRGNGTLATTDTGMIPNFHLKVRSLFTGTSPITFNQTTGAIGINNASATGTKGAASFTGSFSDNGSGVIDLLSLVTAGGCTGCNLTIDAKGRITGYADGAAGATNNTNIGAGFRWLNASSQELRTVANSPTITWDSVSTANTLTAKADTGLLATQYDLSLIETFANNGVSKDADTIQLGGVLVKATHISGGTNGFAFQIDSTSSISLFSGLEYISSGVGSFIQMSDSVMNIGASSATDFTSITFSPTRIKFTAADGTGSIGDVWTNTGSGYGHWATGGAGGTVTNVSGTTNRITVTNPTTTPVVDIAATYVGQTSITTLGTIATGTWNGTAIGATFGGTGQTSVTTGDLLYGSASNVWSKLAGVATGNALISGGVTTAPSWGKIGLTTHVSGILPVANGGTGTATPSLVAGTNVSITGTWPNQTINASGGGGSVNAGIQTTLTGDTLNYDPRINSNLILNDFLLTTIGAKWNASNAPNTTITFASGHMRLVGGSSSDYIYDSVQTIVHRWTEEVGAVIQSVGGSDFFSFGIQSQGIQTILFTIKASDLSGTATYNNGATTLGTTSAQGTTVVGDSVIFRIRRDNFVLYFDVVNVSQSTSQTFTYNYTDVDVVGGTVVPFRDFEITLNPIAGTIDIDYAKLYNQERFGADWLLVSHSIGEGFNAGPPDSTFYNRLQNYFPDKRFALYARSGSVAADYASAGTTKDDMLALRAKRAIILLGVNEIQASVPTATFIANMRALVDTLENRGTQVVIANVTPYNAAHRLAIIDYNTALLTEFGNQVVNIWDTLEVDNGLMQSSNDSLHPDEQGHRYMFNVLKDDITRLVNQPYNPEAITRIFPRGIESGTTSYGMQSNFGIIPLNVGASGTTSPGIGYNVDFQPTNVYKYRESDFANLFQVGNSGKFSFKVAASGTAGDPLTFTEVVTVSTAGDLGVGETTPLAAVHVKRSQAGKTTLAEASVLILDNNSGSTGQRQEIGMGYRNANAYSPIIIGNVVSSGTDFTKSHLYFMTRGVTTNTAPEIRMLIEDSGYVQLYKANIGADSDSAWTWNRSNNRLEYSKINGGGGSQTWQQTLTTGSTLTGANTVTGGNNSFTFDGMFNFRINANSFLQSKTGGGAIYSTSVIGAANLQQYGYTPVAATYSKGSAIVIDTNNNAGLGAQMPTTAPLYATGLSVFANGIQNQAGNFYRVDAVTSNITAALDDYYFRIDATSGNITITLPAASTAFGASVGIHYVFKRIDNSGNTVTIARAGSDTIDGATSITLTTQYEAKALQCSSTSTWDVLP
jgi:hypothetical protein